MGLVLTESAEDSRDITTTAPFIRPIDDITYMKKNNKGELLTYAIPSEASALDFSAMISEGTGTGIVVLMSMVIMSKNQEFTKDKNVQCFTRAAIIVAARLMAGGLMITGVPIGIKPYE